MAESRIVENQVVCMDALEWLKSLPNDSADLLVTDPPYFLSQNGKAISRKYKTMNRPAQADVRLDFGEWDRAWRNEEEYYQWVEKWFKEIVRVLKMGSWLYVFIPDKSICLFLNLCKKYNVKHKTLFVYLKSNPTPSFRKVNWVAGVEYVWCGVKGGGKIKNFLTQKEMYNYMILPNSSSWKVTIHPTEKPLKLVNLFIKTSSFENDVVIDPFMGCGTTAVSAKMLGRVFWGCEINREYYKVALERLNDVSFPLFNNW